MNWPAMESEVAMVSRFAVATAAYGPSSLPAPFLFAGVLAGEPARARFTTTAAMTRQTTTSPNTSNLCHRRTCMNALFSNELISISDATKHERSGRICSESKVDSENNNGGETKRGEAEAGENDALAADGDFLEVGP